MSRIYMLVSEALRELGEFLDECESSGHVTSVKLAGDIGPNPEDPLTAEVEIELPIGRSEQGVTGLSLGEATMNTTGETRFVLESSTPVAPVGDHEVDVSVVDATIDADGSVNATLSASLAVDREGSTTGGVSSTTGASDEPAETAHARTVPPFRDPELLEEVYSSCETFEEMTDEIGMDVTAETVRRYMIDHGIHQPDSYDTADDPETGDADNGTRDTDADGDTARNDEPPGGGVGNNGQETTPDESDEQVVLTDGTGLPDDVTGEMLIDTVKRSNTVLEVKRDLGIERQEALDMLQRLDMVDLVIGRLDAETERDVNREDVIERLQAASATA
jgi:hypothetical protein